jgi:hypothetical protein
MQDSGPDRAVNRKTERIFKITLALREYYGYCGVSADVGAAVVRRNLSLHRPIARSSTNW